MFQKSAPPAARCLDGACTLERPGPHGIWILPVTFVDVRQIREGLRGWLVEAPVQATCRVANG